MINFPIFMSIIILYLVLLLCQAEADTVGPNFPNLQDQTYQPSLAVVIGILGVMFLITMILIAYTKCYGPNGDHRGHNGAGPPGSSKRFQGLERRVIESLPSFRFSSLKGSKEGLECAVCLSRFEDVEVLRLLPKCRHAFHIECIDHWLVKSSSCPLCRTRVGSEDLKLVEDSSSMRLLWGGDRSASELFVQREESRRGSWRFRVGREEESTFPEALHKLNHKIVVSDFAFNNRWSDLRSSDLASLSSEMMLNDASSGRFENNKVGVKTKSRGSSCNGEQRSVSEITVLSRYADPDTRSRSSPISEDRIRKVWLPIAKRTMQWSQFSKTTQRQSLEV